MRSLEEWTEYLEQQEQALKRTLEQEAESDESDQAAEAGRTAKVAAPVIGSDAPQAVMPSASSGAPDASTAGRPAAPTSVRTTARMRKKLPKQLLTAEGRQAEAAQGYYKDFKETREELLQRLIDPQISLEEAARILNVCPTTVRRYTNRGLLEHFRTPGNQRRFRLSDVLAFLESQMSRQPEG